MEKDDKAQVIRKANQKIAFIVVIISILIIGLSVIVFLYAQGLRIEETGTVETGSMRINSEPENVEVYLNEQKYDVNDKQIVGLKPGNYTLSVRKKGYTSWVKDIEIIQGVVENVFVKLFPENLNLTQYTKTNIDSVVFSENGEYMYYVIVNADRGEDIGIWREHITENNPFTFFDSDKIKIANLDELIKSAIVKGEYKLMPSQDNRFLILQTRSKQNNNYEVQHFLLNADKFNEIDKEKIIENDINFAVEKIDWLFNSETLLIKSQGLIAEFDISQKSINVIDFVINGNPTYTIARGKVFFCNHENNVLKVYEKGKIENVKLENIKVVGKVTALFSSRNEDNVLIYRNTNGDYYYLVIDKSYQKQIGNKINIEQISREGDSVIFTDNSFEPSTSQTQDLYSNQDNLKIFTVVEKKALSRFDTKISEIDISKTFNNLQDSQVDSQNIQDNSSQVSSHNAQGTDSQVVQEKKTEINKYIIKSYKFSSTGHNIIVLIEHIESKDNKLFIADKQGQNLKQVQIEDAQVVNGSFMINSSNSKLFMLISELDSLKNIDTKEANNSKQNIYQVKLQID